jgi:phytanoyl-CoA hydroxylase
VENGCTVIVPGSHLMPGLPSHHPEKDSRMASILDQVVPVPMPAGGMVVIDSLVVHGAGPNHTPGTRMSMTAGYHAVDELAGVPDPRRVLVRGERPYMGNDR